MPQLEPYGSMLTLVAFLAIMVVVAAFSLVRAVRRMNNALKGHDAAEGFDVRAKDGPSRPVDGGS